MHADSGLGKRVSDEYHCTLLDRQLGLCRAVQKKPN